MIALKTNEIKISHYLFMAAILLTPVNYDFLSLRLNDILIIFSFFILWKHWRYKYLGALGVLILILTGSNLVGVIVVGDIDLSGLGFYLKWFLLFATCFLSAVHILEARNNIEVYVRSIFYVYIFLCLWVYAYLLLVSLGYIQGKWRVSFPFSSDYVNPDAHLYSSLLAILVFSYLATIKNYLNHQAVSGFFFGALGVIALFMTGSRTGVLMLFLGFSSVLFRNLVTLRWWKVENVATSLAFGLILIAVLFFTTEFFLNSDFAVLGLVERAIYIELWADESSFSRVKKLETALAEVEYSYLLTGVGPLAAELRFYDGISAILLAHGGLILISFSMAMMLYFTRYVYQAVGDRYSRFLVLTMAAMYLVSNLITEYIFITRNFLLVFVAFAIMIKVAAGKYGKPVISEI